MRAIPGAPGWHPLLSTIVRHHLARKGPVHWHREQGHLVVTGPEPGSDSLRGLAAMARALGDEICDRCGGPGDPTVDLAGNGAGTRCHDCRDRSRWPAPRQWRSHWDGTPTPEGEHRLIEERFGTKQVGELMNARYVALDSRGLRPSGGPMHGGWNHLVRALWTVLLPEQHRQGEEPWRLVDIKEKWGTLDVLSAGGNDFTSSADLLGLLVSEVTCIRCGRPGTMRTPARIGWVHPACDACEAIRLADQEVPYGWLRRTRDTQARIEGRAVERDQKIP